MSAIARRRCNIRQLPSVERIIAEVLARHPYMNRELLFTRSNEHRICAARHEVIQLVREQTTLSLPAIGRIFMQHHTTVMHAINKARAAEQIERWAQWKGWSL